MMRDGTVCSDFQALRLIDGIGHWAPQGSPGAVVEIILELVRGRIIRAISPFHRCTKYQAVNIFSNSAVPPLGIRTGNTHASVTQLHPTARALSSISIHPGILSRARCIT